MQSSVYLSDTAVAYRFQVSRATVWRWAHSATFPRPIKLPVGCTRWRLTEIEEWEIAQSQKIRRLHEGPSLYLTQFNSPCRKLGLNRQF